MPTPPAGTPQLEYGIGALKEMIQELPTDRPPLREGYRRLRPAPLPARQPGQGLALTGCSLPAEPREKGPVPAG